MTSGPKWNLACELSIRKKAWDANLSAPTTPAECHNFQLHSHMAISDFVLAEDVQPLVLLSCIANLMKGAAVQARSMISDMYE